MKYVNEDVIDTALLSCLFGTIGTPHFHGLGALKFYRCGCSAQRAKHLSARGIRFEPHLYQGHVFYLVIFIAAFHLPLVEGQMDTTIALFSWHKNAPEFKRH